MNGGRIFGAVEELAEGGFGALKHFFGSFEGTGGSDFPHDALVEEGIAVLAEPHGFDAHAFGGDAGVNGSTIADFDTLLGISSVVDICKVFARDFQTLGMDTKGATAVLE